MLGCLSGRFLLWPVPLDQAIELAREGASLLFRQEIQLSGTDVAKALLILLQRRYMGAGNDDIGRCLRISPTWI